MIAYLLGGPLDGKQYGIFSARPFENFNGYVYRLFNLPGTHPHVAQYIYTGDDIGAPQ